MFLTFAKRNVLVTVSRLLTIQTKLCSSQVSALEVIYHENGDPRNVLKSKTKTLAPLKENEVLVKMMAAPINPADINMIQGVYPIKPVLPAIGGNEGIGKIVELGSEVTSYQRGDWVIPGYSGWGTWRTFAVTAAIDMIKVPSNIPVLNAATLGVNASTAYRMLKDFADLRPGDVVIQNGSNSSVGQFVIQIAKSMKLTTVNIIRNRPNINELVNVLKDNGADYVITDEFVRTPEMKTLLKSLPRPKLALNCVGGRSTAELLKYLEKGSTMVTYGGMSKQPLMVPAGPLIFSDVKLRGFWVTRWNKECSNNDRQQMWQVLSQMIQDRIITLPLYEMVNIQNFEHGVASSMDSFTSRKQILIMDEDIL